MSELKTNKISPAVGTGVTLGDSGDTFTIPAGVTLAGNIPAANLTGALPAISGANLTNLPATGLSSKALSANYNLASAAGTVDYTGVGFQPTACIIYTCEEGAAGLSSIGFLDSSGGGYGIADYHNVVANGHAANGVNEIGFYGSPGNNVLGNTTFISDGVRVVWTKSGSLSGTAGLIFLCLK